MGFLFWASQGGAGRARLDEHSPKAERRRGKTSRKEGLLPAPRKGLFGAM